MLVSCHMQVGHRFAARSGMHLRRAWYTRCQAEAIAADLLLSRFHYTFNQSLLCQEGTVWRCDIGWSEVFADLTTGTVIAYPFAFTRQEETDPKPVTRYV